MSNSNMPAPAGEQGKVGAARQESVELKQTVQEQAGDVASTVKDEATNVAAEARSQARELYHRTRAELREQADVQQRRVAVGLRSVGDELQDMAAASEHPGMGADLVREAAGRARGAAEWLGARDPEALLREVKSFARRKPGTFIIAAAIAGVVVGRLTRALASDAADERREASTAASGAVARPVPGAARGPVPTPPPPVTHLSSPDGRPAVPAVPTAHDAGTAHSAPDPLAAPERELLDPAPELGAPRPGAPSPGSAPRHGAVDPLAAPVDRVPDADRLPDEGGLR